MSDPVQVRASFVCHRFAERVHEWSGWRSDAEREAYLSPLMPLLSATTGDFSVERRRALYLADIAVRKISPIAMDAAGLAERASELRNLPGTGDVSGAAFAVACAADDAFDAARLAIASSRTTNGKAAPHLADGSSDDTTGAGVPAGVRKALIAVEGNADEAVRYASIAGRSANAGRAAREALVLASNDDTTEAAARAAASADLAYVANGSAVAELRDILTDALVAVCGMKP